MKSFYRALFLATSIPYFFDTLSALKEEVTTSTQNRSPRMTTRYKSTVINEDTIINATSDQTLKDLYQDKKKFIDAGCLFNVTDKKIQLFPAYNNIKALDMVVYAKAAEQSLLCDGNDTCIAYELAYDIPNKKTGVKKIYTLPSTEQFIANQVGNNTITYQNTPYTVHRIQRNEYAQERNSTEQSIYYFVTKENDNGSQFEYVISQLLEKYSNTTQPIVKQSSIIPVAIAQFLKRANNKLSYDTKIYSLIDKSVRKILELNSQELWLLSGTFTAGEKDPILKVDTYYSLSPNAIENTDLIYLIEKNASKNDRNLFLEQGFVYQNRLYEVKNIEHKKISNAEKKTFYTFLFKTPLFKDIAAPSKKKLLIIDTQKINNQNNWETTTKTFELTHTQPSPQ